MTETTAGGGRLAQLLGGLRHRDFTILVTTFLITQTGFWLSTVALQWQTARLTDNDPFLLGLLYFVNLVPLLVLSPIGGTIADRIDRRKIVITGQFVTAFLAGILVLGLATVGPSLPLLFGFAVSIGATMALLGSANMALMVNAVPVEDMRSAISLQAASQNIARMVGPSIAGALLAAYGAWAAFTGYLATSVASAVALLALRVPPIDVEHDPSGMLERIRAGLRHVREREPAAQALMLVAANAFFGSSYVPMLTVFAYDVHEGGDPVFTLFFVVVGVGALVGAASNGMRNQPLTIRGALGLSFALGTALVTFSLSRNLALSTLALIMVGAANLGVMTGLNVAIQSVVDEHQRGRVMSLFIVAWGGLVPLGALSVGAVADLVGSVAAMLIYGGGLLTVSLGGLALQGRRRARA